MYDFYSYFETTGICSIHKQKHHSLNHQTSSMQFSSLILCLKERLHWIFTVTIVHVLALCSQLVKFILMSHIVKHYIFVTKFINIYLWAYSYTGYFFLVVFALGLIFTNFLCLSKEYFCLLKPHELSLM